jgi:F420-non-reducing hydrogenase iron-sulfur subunit
MFKIAKQVTKTLGINPNRLRLEWISSAEGAKFAEVAREFLEQVREVGPSPLKQTA